MDIGNVLNSCEETGANTGIGSCFNNIGFIKGLIFVPPGMTFTTASIAAFKTAIEAALLADNPSLRAYPIGDFRAPTDSSEAAVEQKFPDGSIAIVRGAFYDWSFQFVKGGLCLSIAMQLANGLNRWFFVIDDQGKLYGVNAGIGLIQGVNPNLAYTPPFKLNTGAAVTEYLTRINFSADQLNKYAKYLDFSNDGGNIYLQSLQGLQNVIMTSQAARAAGVMKVTGFTDCGTVNLHDLFATELAVTGAFKVRNKATKNALTVTAVADDPTDNGFSVTVSTSDPNYAAAGLLEISFVGPTELDALDVTGYESNWLTI